MGKQLNLFFLKVSLISALCFNAAGCNIYTDYWRSSPSNFSVADISTDFSSLDKLELAPATKHDGEVLHIAPFEDRTTYQFISIGRDGQVLIWRTDNSKPYVLSKIDQQIDTATIDANNGIIGWTSNLKINAASLDLKTIRTYQIPSRAKSLAFTLDGNSLLVGAIDAKIYRWRFDLQEKANRKSDREKVLERYVGTAEIISAVVPHPDRNLFFTTDWAGSLQAWQLYTADRLGGQGIQNKLSPMYFSTLAVRNRAAREAKTERLEQMAMTPNGAELFVATNGGDIEVWKVRGLQKAGMIHAHNADLIALAVSPSGHHIASSGRDGLVNVFSIRRLDPEELIELTDRTVEYEITGEKSFPLSDVRTLRFLTETRLVAGTKSGSVLAIDTN